MSIISFDIIYKNKVDNDSIKLSSESEYQQLKLMICGKYKIYDLNNIYIYYKGNLITKDDITKLKDIFKLKKVKIEISEYKLEKYKPIPFSKYPCNNCSKPANYICDKCQEFICDFCLKKKKHITHEQKVVKINNYPNYIRKLLKELANELDSKILNDEAYKFFKYWEYDKDKEISSINNIFEFIKMQIEDIKQLQIDIILKLSESNKYSLLKNKIEDTMQKYALVDTDTDVANIFEQKNTIVQDSQEILTWYNELKLELLAYTKTVKEFQSYNELLKKFINDKFSSIKKKFPNNEIDIDFIDDYNNKTSNTNRLLGNSFSAANLNSNNLNNSAVLVKSKNTNTKPKNISKNKSKKSYKLSSPQTSPFVKRQTNNSTIKKDKKTKKVSSSKNLLSPISIMNTSLNKSQKMLDNQNIVSIHNNTIINQSINASPYIFNNQSLNISPNECLLMKLKNQRKIIVFFLESQTFKEKIYIDKGNFRRDLTSEADVIQLNLNNRLYMLSGKKNNKFYIYVYHSNTLYYINNTLYQHYYGAMIYCNKNNMIYLLGGNNQLNNEVFELPSTESKGKWRILPPLNEERQEFAAMVFNDYLYVFFGFSHIKGVNLSSIERMDINIQDKFEIVYVNEQITLSSIGCAKFYDEFQGYEGNNSGGGILLLGGFNGEMYIESTLVFVPDQMKIRECDIIIPNLNKHFQFLFNKEVNFIELDNQCQINFDMKNNVHLITRDSYKLFSEAQ